MTRRSVIRFRRKVRRDTILFVFGLSGITYMMISEKVNTALVILCGLMAGVPGLAGALSLLGVKLDDTTGSESPSPQPSSPPSPSTPSHT